MSAALLANSAWGLLTFGENETDLLLGLTENELTGVSANLLHGFERFHLQNRPQRIHGPGPTLVSPGAGRRYFVELVQTGSTPAGTVVPVDMTFTLALSKGPTATGSASIQTLICVRAEVQSQS
jgi:hypothetical protein